MSSSTVLGKRKAADDSSTRRSRKRLSAAELYNPTMVTIVVSQAAVVGKDENAPSEEFVVPRGLIRSHSKYFESAFRKQWSESRSKTLQIDDVSPMIFRIFVAWLFYQEIFYDEERIEPDNTAPCTSGQQSNSTAQGLFAEGRATSHQKTSANTITSSSDTDAGTDGNDEQVEKEPLPVRCHIDPYDPYDAMTWPWIDLFELYVFSEKYDTRGLRIKVFDLIQLRMARNAMLYESRWLPDPDDITYLIDNMPQNSKLLQLLSRYYQAQSARAVERRFPKLCRMPSSFLAQCYLQSMRFMQAKHCPTCQARQRHTHDRAHTWEDTVPAQAIGPCVCHEHGDDLEEAAECQERWKVRMQALKDEVAQKADTVATSQEIITIVP
ncbi:unnamed protein product [Cercospora beticola]|nr:unnamed protein product [Cercospora beticola]